MNSFMHHSQHLQLDETGDKYERDYIMYQEYIYLHGDIGYTNSVVQICIRSMVTGKYFSNGAL